MQEVRDRRRAADDCGSQLIPAGQCRQQRRTGSFVRISDSDDLAGAREPRGQGGSFDPPEISLGRQTWYFDSPDFWKTFSGKHPHVVIEATS